MSLAGVYDVGIDKSNSNLIGLELLTDRVGWSGWVGASYQNRVAIYWLPSVKGLAVRIGLAAKSFEPPKVAHYQRLRLNHHQRRSEGLRSSKTVDWSIHAALWLNHQPLSYGTS